MYQLFGISQLAQLLLVLCNQGGFLWGSMWVGVLLYTRVPSRIISQRESFCKGHLGNSNQAHTMKNAETIIFFY